MTGTVIRVLSGVDNQTYVSVERTTVGEVDPSIAALALDATVDPLLAFFQRNGEVTPELLKRVGIAIYKALTSNPVIPRVLDALRLIGRTQTAPLYLYLDSVKADEYPWEVLFHEANPANPADEGFLALDPRWPIGRIVGRGRGEKTELSFTPPLRMLVVLASAGVSSRGEWVAIWDPIKASGVAVKLLVMLCEKPLKDEIDALQDPNIETQYVLDGIRFRQSLNAFTPNLLHFFCHGLGGSMPKLQLATRADFDTGAAFGSVEVQPKDLDMANELHNSLWLVTLNCCEGAKGGSVAPAPAPAGAAAPAGGAAPPAPVSLPQGIHSFARSLVELWGFPAVVGMRERIEVSAAFKFSRSFYGSVFSQLKGVLERPEPSPPIEWVRMLTQPRSDLEPLGSLPWNLPVLYVRPEDLLLEPSSPDQKPAQVELRVLRDFRDGVGNSLPPEKLEALIQRIRQLEQTLAP